MISKMRVNGYKLTVSRRDAKKIVFVALVIALLIHFLMVGYILHQLNYNMLKFKITPQRVKQYVSIQEFRKLIIEKSVENNILSNRFPINAYRSITDLHNSVARRKMEAQLKIVACVGLPIILLIHILLVVYIWDQLKPDIPMEFKMPSQQLKQYYNVQSLSVFD